jgi:ATP-dependent DNA ligase
MTYVIFDVLTLNGESLMRAPYSERRAHLAEASGWASLLGVVRT